MILPTPEEVLAAKTDAAARFGRDEVLLTRMAAPIDLCMLSAPLNLDAYCALADEQGHDLQTANRNVVLRRRLWPSAAIVTERLGRRPAMADKIVRALFKRAGTSVEQPVVELLADMIAKTAADADVIPGLSLTASRALLAGDEGAEMWGVTGPGGLSLVMATPDGDVWLAAQAAKQKASESNARIVMSALDFALQSVKWTARPLLGDLLDDMPALCVDVRRAYDIIGGEGADATSKSL